tara:strand:+ start:301 stop:507 length:207 start_codon:yes stop_codon:yes gene_type:complete
MTRFRSDATRVIGLVLSINEYGLVHESIKGTIKNFKNKEDSLSQDVVYEFQKILESIEKQAKCIVDVY